MEGRAARPVLVVGIGNPSAGDDGVGWEVVGRLRDDPRRPDTVEAIQTRDLLTLHDRLLGHERVFLVDALLDDPPSGRLVIVDDLHRADTPDGSVHHLSPARALLFLQAVYPELREVPTVLAGITIERARFQPKLSPALARRLDSLVDDVLDLIGAGG